MKKSRFYLLVGTAEKRHTHGRVLNGRLPFGDRADHAGRILLFTQGLREPDDQYAFFGRLVKPWPQETGDREDDETIGACYTIEERTIKIWRFHRPQRGDGEVLMRIELSLKRDPVQVMIQINEIMGRRAIPSKEAAMSAANHALVHAS